MSDSKPVSYTIRSATPRDPENEVKFLRRRAAELEMQNQQLYQQIFLLQQRLSSSSLTEKERAEFISNVAHELRTPLTSIKGYVDLILQGETGPVNDLQNEFLSIVGLNAEKLAGIIGDLLDVTRMEAGRMILKPTLVNLMEFIGELAEQSQPQLAAIGVELEVNLPTSGRLTASLDTERFSQALRAILAHAGQVTPEGGKVRFTLQADKTDTTAHIEIEDQSGGIHPADVDRVFTKFWKPTNPISREGNNPGLGLAIAKSIVDMHEGKIGAANRPEGEQGVIFTISLPLVNRAIEELVNFNQEEAQTTRHYAALVFSKNEDFGKVVQNSLESSGFQILLSSDPGELLTETPAWQPDLIISDAAEGNLLTDFEDKPLPPALRKAAILALSLSEIEQRLILAGAQAVLPWPYSEVAFVDTLQQLTGVEEQDKNNKTDKPEDNLSILLVSGASDTLRILDKLLHESGFAKIHRAMRESDALTLARRFKPDWLLLDMCEFEPGGPEQQSMLEILREDRYLQDVPAIVLARPDWIAPAPATAYQPALRGGTGKLRRRGGSGELLARGVSTEDLRRRATGELRKGTGDLRRGATGELRIEDNMKPLVNVVPKPFLQRRFIQIAQRLLDK